MSKALVVVTGASSGIGAAAAKALSAAGHPVLLTARRVERLEALDLPNSICRRNDVTDLDGFRVAVAEAEKEYGPVDLLVNNAGWMTLNDFADQVPDDWRRQFEVNVLGLLNTTSVVFPGMIGRKTGTILNIGSTSGHSHVPKHTVYGGTKYAVRGLTEGLRREGAPHNVRVILISPGMVDTELLTGTRDPKIIKDYESFKTYLNGAIDPVEIGKAILFAYQQPQEIAVWEMIIAPTGQRT